MEKLRFAAAALPRSCRVIAFGVLAMLTAFTNAEQVDFEYSKSLVPYEVIGKVKGLSLIHI